jgi:hypothetical protein
MTLGGVELIRVVRRFRRVIREPSSSRLFGPVFVTGSWLVRLPGMRSHAPKRNVILALVYLYVLLILVSVGSVSLS